jgi:hypothetical protein
LLACGRAEALCAGTPDDLEVVGYIPDIVFTAGVPENRTISHRHVLRPAVSPPNVAPPPFVDCGSLARSKTKGLSVRSTYFDFGVLHGPGEWAGLNGSHPSLGTPVVLPPINLELVFDGSAPAGTVGTVELAHRMGGEIAFVPRLIGVVNVYVVAPGAALPQTWFTVVGEPSSISGSRLVLDHPLLNGAPGHSIFASPVRVGRVAAWRHPISVGYDEALERWTIHNDDAAAMVDGVAFNVRIDPSARILGRSRQSPELPKHPTVPSTVPIARMRIDDPRANHNPFATIFVTAASPNPHPIAVRYEAPSWHIVNADGRPMSRLQRFHVQVFGATAYRSDLYRGRFPVNPLRTNELSNGVGVDMHGLGAARNADANRFLDFPWALAAHTPMIVTPNQTPTGRHPIVDTAYVGVWFTGAPTTPANRWAVAHADGSPMPNASSFNVWSPPLVRDAFGPDERLPDALRVP